MRKLKVYGWTSFRHECRPAPNGSHQTREIVAAHSQAETARLSGHRRPSQMWYLCETGNANEIETAMSKPGTVFWHPLDDWSSNPTWTEAKGVGE